MSGKDAPAKQEGREFLFTSQDFQRIRDLIHSHAGIALGEGKQELVYSRLSRRLRATGIRTFAEYLQLLERGDKAEWELFANSLTTNLTSFFREPHHFTILAEYLRSIKERRPLTFWCSASSTGEEAYSMAMTVVDVFGSHAPPINIIASDIDTKVLETARQGIYPEERVSKLDPDQVRRFFMRGAGVEAGQVRVRQELRDMITFRQINLLHDDWPLRPPLDAIFCRNVMIYFDKPTQLRILKKFVPLLCDNGLLFAGHSESFYFADEYFKLRGRTVYELSAKVKAQRAANPIAERHG